MTRIVDAPPQSADAEAVPVVEPVGRHAPDDRKRTATGSRAPLVILSGLMLISALMLGFVGYLFALTPVSEARAQRNLFKTFTRALAQAVAPVGPTSIGSPVAVLDIPAIGLHNVVVVEGTDARRLTEGPGHRRDTPLPGQSGVSVIYGRRGTFGGPFAKITRLHLGDGISAVTGQGVATYVVTSFGEGGRPAPSTSANRIVLTTADSAFVPHSTLTVSADLRSPSQPAPGGLPVINATERGMRGAAAISALPLMLWCQVLLALAVIGTIAVTRWARRPAYMCIAPCVIAVLWNVYENAAMLLPNVL